MINTEIDCPPPLILLPPHISQQNLRNCSVAPAPEAEDNIAPLMLING